MREASDDASTLLTIPRNVISTVSREASMGLKTCKGHAHILVKKYLLADPFAPYTSILTGFVACKMVYDLAQLFSATQFKSFCSLPKLQRIEWNNRVISTVHAIFITFFSLYFISYSDLFSDQHHSSFVTFQSSSLSSLVLGISVGYFISDLAMILWFYPSLGGPEYVVHHLLSMIAVAYALFTGEGQLYTFMVLVSEMTTPGVNLRWFLDTVGMKRSRIYLVNGILMFFAWLVARIFLFIYLFHHVFVHFNQVKKMHFIGLLLVLVVPVVLFVMNVMWFLKIIKGLKKTITKRH